MNENTTTDTTELDRLREHNKQLLAELKAERTAHKATQDAMASSEATHATTTAELRALRLDGPVQGLLNTISPSPKMMLSAIREHAQFDLDGDGKPVILALDGQPLSYEAPGKNGQTITELVKFTPESIAWWLNTAFPQGAKDTPAVLMHKAQGTGAPGATYRPSPPRSNPADTPAPAPRPAFGLR